MNAKATAIKVFRRYALIGLILFYLVTLSTCFSPWTGEETGGMAIISLSLGGNGASRLVVDLLTGGGPLGLDPEFEDFEYDLFLFSNGSKLGGSYRLNLVKIAGMVSASYELSGAAPIGDYSKIVVKAYSVSGSVRTQRGEGTFLSSGPPIEITAAGIVYSGSPSLLIEIVSVTTVSSWSELKDHVDPSGAFGSTAGTRPEIFILKPGPFGYWDIFSTFLTPSVIQVTRPITLRTEGDVVTLIRDNYNGDEFFEVTLGGSLTLETDGGSLIMDGDKTSYGNPFGSPFINVQNGTLTINDDGIILRNNFRDIGGGAVYINQSDFYMYGGIIEGNEVSGPGASGGGVQVITGNFTMTGGKIINNISGSDGGGVSIIGSALLPCTFTMDGGEISGNTSSGPGGGVILLFQSKLIMSGGIITGNTASGGGGVRLDFGMSELHINSPAVPGAGGNITGNTDSSMVPDNVSLLGGAAVYHDSIQLAAPFDTW